MKKKFQRTIRELSGTIVHIEKTQSIRSPQHVETDIYSSFGQIIDFESLKDDLP